MYRRTPISQFKTLNMVTLNSLFFSFGSPNLKLPTINYLREYYPEEAEYNEESDHEIKQETEDLNNDSDYEEFLEKKKNAKR